MNIIWFILIGLLVAYLARISMYPRTRFYEPWGIFFITVIAAILAGTFSPVESIFLAPFVFLGSLFMAFLASVLAVWLVAIFLVLITPE